MSGPAAISARPAAPPTKRATWSGPSAPTAEPSLSFARRSTSSFRLSEFEKPLLEYVSNKDYWRPSVQLFTQNWLQAGLIDRAVTRDMSWGVPVPVPGYEDKVIYVWFEAVIGYLSASKEWAKSIGTTGRMEGVLDRPRGPFLLLPGQGQHTVPHHHLACHPAWLWRPQPPLRRASQRVADVQGGEVLQEPWRRRGRPQFPEEVRLGPGALLSDGQHARGQGRRFLLGGLRRQDQQRTGGDAGQLLSPGAKFHPEELRFDPGAADARARRRNARRCTTP